ncbi:hypothetical protein K2Q16_03350 [Patescibacteria group bacterium]|nr:hypothetical protein [Patescibacteria group bacterium]
MVTKTLLGVVAVGSVGYLAADLASATDIAKSYQAPLTKTVMSVSAHASVAQTRAKAFALDVQEFKSYTKSGTYDTERLIMHRDRIRDSFEAAYWAIETLEHEGEEREAEIARDLMQYAIDEYMSNSTTEKSPPITLDLETYSRFLTETFIARSLATTH